MNKTELVNKVSETTGLSKGDADKAVSAVFDTISEAYISGESVKIIGFGTFETRDTPARKGRNPQSGAEIEIAASRTPKFKASDTLKNKVKK